jgi:hypothetical protein
MFDFVQFIKVIAVFLGILVGFGIVIRFIVARQSSRSAALIVWGLGAGFIFASGSFFLMELSNKYDSLSTAAKLGEAGKIFLLASIGGGLLALLRLADYKK